MDCYAVLGIQSDASQKEIKAAFRERALECHPDQAADGEKEAAKEEFQRVKTAFEVLSDPGRRASYDASDQEGDVTEDVDETGGSRRRSYRAEWRTYRQKDRITLSRVILERVGGLSADRDVIENRTSFTVPICALLGTLFFLVEPQAIYASDVFLVDLFFCTAIGGIYGYILGNVWGYVELYLQKRSE